MNEMSNVDVELILVDPNEALCREWQMAFAKRPGVSVVCGRFEALPEFDCMVSAANSFGLMDGGVDLAITRFFGVPLMDILIPVLGTWGLNLMPDLSPMDDIRVRRAIVHAIDRKQMNRIWGSGSPSSNGGIVPPGIPGHSPELGLEFDPEQARQLLAQAGYSTTENFPVLKYYYGEFAHPGIQEELRRQLLAHLGVRVEFIPLTSTGARWAVEDSLMQWVGWAADYPDPDNFLRQSSFRRALWDRGWRHPRLEHLLEEAAHTTDRARRLAMCREADRILVNEEAVVMPLTYSSNAYFALLKPWVRGYKRNALNNYSLKDIVIEPH